MKTKDDNFIKALLCLDLNLTTLRVLICWCCNSTDYPPTQQQIANELGINKERVCKAFRNLLKLDILENISPTKARVEYVFSSFAWSKFESWKILNLERHRGCLTRHSKDICSDNHTNNSFSNYEKRDRQLRLESSPNEYLRSDLLKLIQNKDKTNE
jgi:predicted transcriptional regulator